MPKRPMARALEEWREWREWIPPLCAGAQTLWFEKERDTGLAKPKVPLSSSHRDASTLSKQFLHHLNPPTQITPRRVMVQEGLLEEPRGLRIESDSTDASSFQSLVRRGLRSPVAARRRRHRPAALQYRPWLPPSNITNRPADFAIAD
jgi:hypothetical protein